jgi:signal transduction histidine kinase/ActR/RegA family two-component response regulator
MVAPSVIVGVAYFLAARLGLALLENSDGVAVFWPAAGIASGILIGFGPSARWPVIIGVMTATIIANVMGDRNLISSIFFAVANAGEAILVAGLIERFYRSPFELDELRRVLAFFAATATGTIISGVIGTIGFVLFHSSTTPAATIWFHWVSSDSIGTITVAPLVIAVASLMRDPPPRREILEGVLALAILLVLGAFLVLLSNQPWTAELAIASLCPIFVWIAARVRPAFTAAAAFICAMTVVWTTTFAIGIFGDIRLPIDVRIISAQATILATSFGGLVLAALFSERRLHEKALLERESQLQDALRAAELADRAKSSFLAAASHDLRQPLQTLRFLKGALEPHHPDGEGLHLVNGISRSLDTMSNILSSLLDVSQLESGRLTPTEADFMIGDMFDSVATDFYDPVMEKNLSCRLVRSELRIRSDRRMLEEMVRNLLSNAVRYTDRGKILLGCRRTGSRVRIEVWDSGIGVAADQLPHIFDEYYQGREGVERGGFGLGLAIVKRLGDVLHHKVSVRSTPGKGTCVSIEVPRGQPIAEVPSSAPAPDPYHQTFRGNLLVIEDEISVRTAIYRLLKANGIGVVAAATTSEALALVGQQDTRPDVVLCDYNLRGSANGVESIKTLRAALGQDVPAIVMTGDTRSLTREAIASHGISVLIKPFVANELLQLIAQLQRGSETAGTPLNDPALF